MQQYFLCIGWSIKSAKVKDFVAEAKEQADRIMQNANLEAESLKKEKWLRVRTRFTNCGKSPTKKSVPKKKTQ